MIRAHLIACCLSMGGLSAAVYEAPSPEPTPEEVAILEAMNRFRANPVAEADRLLADRHLYWTPDNVDWRMFEQEVKALPPAPPLVFDLQALDSARKHSYYMIHNGLGHNQEPGKEGFTGKKFSDRMKAAGFTGAPGGENCFRDARSAEHSNFAFIVDFGPGGPGGMQKGRGHRINMANPGFAVVGPSAVTHGEKFSVTHNFGRSKDRFAGGVIYKDLNRNGAYDVGEGIGGIEVSSGKKRTKTWASGAYTLKLDNQAGTIQASREDTSYSLSFSKGKDNVGFSWAVPPAADLKAADSLIANLEALGDDPKNERKRLSAQVDLYLRSQTLAVDAERQHKISELTEALAVKIQQAQSVVLKSLEPYDRKALSTALREGRKEFGRTALKDWFDECEELGKAARLVNQAVENPDRLTASTQQKLLKALDDAIEANSAPSLMPRWRGLKTQVEALTPRK